MGCPLLKFQTMNYYITVSLLDMPPPHSFQMFILFIILTWFQPVIVLSLASMCQKTWVHICSHLCQLKHQNHPALFKPNVVTSKTCQSYLALSTLTTTMLRLETSCCCTSYSPVVPTTSEAEGKVNLCLRGLLVILYRSAILESWKATGCNSQSCVQNGSESSDFRLSKIWGLIGNLSERHVYHITTQNKIYCQMYRNNKTQIR